MDAGSGDGRLTLAALPPLARIARIIDMAAYREGSADPVRQQLAEAKAKYVLVHLTEVHELILAIEERAGPATLARAIEAAKAAMGKPSRRVRARETEEA